ncbi:hypothetical protein ACFV1L_35975 [Kitasatospora sp. NPDC059646]|uniref:hypothetical protein n=1 Tax=Kitasatospora sp. NPDC059646 TaxID=3346893 RepID=UPI0036C42F75
MSTTDQRAPWTNRTSHSELDELLFGPLAPGAEPVAGRLLLDLLAESGVRPHGGPEYLGGGCWVLRFRTEGGGGLWVSDAMARVGHPVDHHSGWTVARVADLTEGDIDGESVPLYLAADGTGFAEDTAACAAVIRAHAAR